MLLEYSVVSAVSNGLGTQKRRSFWYSGQSRREKKGRVRQSFQEARHLIQTLRMSGRR